ncbi:hypothetical protein Esti_001377 [Eimeria stiedai]
MESACWDSVVARRCAEVELANCTPSLPRNLLLYLALHLVCCGAVNRTQRSSLTHWESSFEQLLRAARLKLWCGAYSVVSFEVIFTAYSVSSSKEPVDYADSVGRGMNASHRRADGRVRTKTVKRAARQIVEKYYAKLTLDFQVNKKIAEEVALIPSKRVRNKVAGFITHLMKRIQRGPVRGISLKLQEEERERRMDFVPEKSELDVATISIDQDTAEMLQALNISLPNVTVASAHRGGMGNRGMRP